MECVSQKGEKMIEGLLWAIFILILSVIFGTSGILILRDILETLQKQKP
jgi:hypothetical protein